MTPEQKASEIVRLRASAWGMKLFRNNVGALPRPDGVPVRFGLGNESKALNKIMKSSDFIGVHQVVVTPEMVGKKIGVFAALEAKPIGFVHRVVYPKDSREAAQQKFMNLIIECGGLAGFVSNDTDVDQAVHNFNMRFEK